MRKTREFISSLTSSVISSLFVLFFFYSRLFLSRGLVFETRIQLWIKKNIFFVVIMRVWLCIRRWESITQLSTVWNFPAADTIDPFLLIKTKKYFKNTLFISSQPLMARNLSNFRVDFLAPIYYFANESARRDQWAWVILVLSEALIGHRLSNPIVRIFLDKSLSLEKIEFLILEEIQC